MKRASAHKEGRLIFGKPSLSRLMCSKCQEETMHKWGVCVHCGTKVPTQPEHRTFAPRGRKAMKMRLALGQPISLGHAPQHDRRR